MDKVEAKTQSGRVYKTAYLPTDDEKVAKLQSLFRARPNQGDFLLPNQAFYDLDLNDMAQAMLEWIGITLSDRLRVGYKQDYVAAGLGDNAGIYLEQAGIHYILLNPAKVQNPYQAAAVLAHELMHYVLMGLGNLKLEDTYENGNGNEKFTDIATVYTGLGIIIANGLGYKSGKALALSACTFGMVRVKGQKLPVGCSSPQQYARMIKDYAQSYKISYEQYAGYLLPWTKPFLPRGLKRASHTVVKKSDLASLMQKSIRKQRTLAAATATLLVLVAGPLAISAMPGITSKVSASALLTKMQGHLDKQAARLELLQKRVETCTSNLNSRHDHIDAYDSNAIEAYNTAAASCNRLRSQYNAQAASYNAKVAR